MDQLRQHLMRSVKETLAAMFEKCFGVVFVEEVLDEEIEALIQRTSKERVPIVTLRQLTKSMTN